MKSIEHLERLILRLPTIARETDTLDAFWRKIDEAMELVWDCMQTEAERPEIETRYGDLIDMANALGLVELDY